MNRKVYAISLLLSFMVVFGHMMVPHHHHESFEVEFLSPQNHQSNHSHVHNGKHHHSHDEDKGDNQNEEHSDQNFPQHFHLSATDDIDLARVNNFLTKDYKQDLRNLISAELFFNKFLEPPNILEDSYSDCEIPSNTQYEPEANSLRGPPSIA